MSLSTLINQDLRRPSIPDRIMFDMSVFNNDFVGGNDIEAEFEENRNAPIVPDTSFYDVSIGRFHIDTLSIPVFIPLIKDPSSDINETIYSFTMKYKTFEYQRFLRFIPEDPTIVAPALSSKQDIKTGYYNVYSFQYVNFLLTECLKECFDALKVLVTTGGDTLPTNHEPYLNYDTSTSECVLFADELGFDEHLANPIEIYVNKGMHRLLSTFQYVRYKNNVTNGKDYQLRVYNNGSNRIELEDYNALISLQEAPCSGLWSPVDSIVFTTNNLPIEPTLMPTIKQFGETQGESFSQNVQSIITDFQVSQVSGKEILGSLNMLPYFYRKTSMKSHNVDLKNINIKVYWKMITGDLIPLLLPVGCNANLKLIFTRRDLSN